MQVCGQRVGGATAPHSAAGVMNRLLFLPKLPARRILFSQDCASSEKSYVFIPEANSSLDSTANLTEGTVEPVPL